MTSTRPGRYSQISRVLYIFRLLEASPHGLTVARLHELIQERYEVDKRTVYRDLEALSAAGLPVIEEPDAHGEREKRWKLDQTLKVAKSLIFSPRELVALYLARNALSPLRDTPFYQDLDEAFNKIESALGPKGLNYLRDISAGIHFEPGPRWGLGTDPEVIDTVRACCDEGQKLSVIYRSFNSGDERRRVLGPHFIYFARGSVYLVAEDIEAAETKVFSIPRMRDAKMLDEKYEGQPVDPNTFFESAFNVFRGDTVETVKLSFAPAVADYIRERRWHNSQQIVPQADGSVQMTLHVSASYELVQWILGFGANVTVTSPASLRGKIIASAQEILGIYGKNKAA